MSFPKLPDEALVQMFIEILSRLLSEMLCFSSHLHSYSHLINKLNTVMIKKTKTNNIFMFVIFYLQIRLQTMSKKEEEEEEDLCSVQLHSPCSLLFLFSVSQK